LDKAGDAAGELFAALDAAPVAVFASPIYFYHVPAIFKAFIDRAQRRYEVRLADGPGQAADRLAYPLLVAGRPRGERLFEGALLTLKYFLWPFGYLPGPPTLLRGLDAPGDLAGDGPALAALEAAGEAAGEAVGP
jgi:multimeric flavodoxin WrbA